MAITQTYTVTVPRLSLIRTQVAIALHRGANIPEASLTKVKLGLDKRWIGTVFVHGFDGSGACRAEVALMIDWARCELAVQRGHSMVSIDNSWRDQVAPEVDETIAEFVDFCRANNLSRQWRVAYSDRVTRSNEAEVDRQLGFTTAPKIHWAGEAGQFDFRVRELDELTGWIRLVE